MDFTEIIVEVLIKDLELASNISHMVVPYGLYIEDYSDLEQESWQIAHVDLIDEDLLNKDRENALIHIFLPPQENPAECLAFLKERFIASNIEYKFKTQKCNPQEFLLNWKKYFKPFKVGKKLVVKPTWEVLLENKENRSVLEIDPGMAFGTGTHETTKMCLELLEDCSPIDKTVLDVGCGSGILSLASLVLGAKSARGIDIDQMAVKTANENAKVNKLEEKFNAVCGNLTENTSGKFDIIFANIVADAIILLNEQIKKYMHKNSLYIVSGIINFREQEVIDSLRKEFVIEKIERQRDWVSFLAKPKFK